MKLWYFYARHKIKSTLINLIGAHGYVCPFSEEKNSVFFFSGWDFFCSLDEFTRYICASNHSTRNSFCLSFSIYDVLKVKVWKQFLFVLFSLLVSCAYILYRFGWLKYASHFSNNKTTEKKIVSFTIPIDSELFYISMSCYVGGFFLCAALWDCLK